MALLTEVWPSASRLLQRPSQLSWCFCHSWIPERALRAISLCIPCPHCIPSNSCASHIGYFYLATFIFGQLDSWGCLSGGSMFSGYICRHMPGPGCMFPSVLAASLQGRADDVRPKPVPGHDRDRQAELSFGACGQRVTAGCGQLPEPCPDGLVTWIPGDVQDSFLGATSATPLVL